MGNNSKYNRKELTQRDIQSIKDNREYGIAIDKISRMYHISIAKVKELCNEPVKTRLTKEQKQEIKTLKANNPNFSLRKLASMFNTSHGTIKNILT